MTFDDGPDPVWTPKVLEALDRVRARATFFVLGRRAIEHAGLIRRIVRGGHEVGLHCRAHIRHTEMTLQKLRADTALSLRDLHTIGVNPRLWRPPWGVMTGDTLQVARENGLKLVLWTLDTHDWRGDGAGEMMERISEGLRPGSVILMHDGLGPGAKRRGCGETVRLIAALTERIRQVGCEPDLLPGKNEATP